MIVDGGKPAADTRPGRVATTLCWLAVAPAALWAALRLAGLDRGPAVQALAFTPYVAAWSPLPVVLAFALRRRWAAAVAAVTAVALLAVVAPRAVAAEPPPATGPTVRLLTANLLAGAADPAVLVDLVRRHHVDVLVVQEFTPAAQADLDRLGLDRLLPHRQLNPLVGTPGSGLYARFPVSEPGVRRHRGGWGFTQAYATVAVPGAPPVHVESAHPAAPYALDQLGFWHEDLAAQPPATPDGPLRILAGDFNATLDHAPLRALLSTGYVDAADATGQGLVGTWGPYDGDLIPPVTIDHVLVDRRVAVQRVEVLDLPGTDHRPVLATLRLP
ncbi:endonuclease/exonuclease/phosphatase family protein [Micromonospora sp. NPDC049366]|uniref:endonuclease/exonuclease/phosphatase family protein n=1 Tax=Micromonospora sp. NPDC049366 TaxID=3364271 RepID=UPI00379C0261